MTLLTRISCGPILTPQQAEENARTYAEQAFRILDREKTMVRYNAEWLSKLTFADLIQLASNFTIQQFLTRENFAQRWEKGDAIYLHETFYSIMQGYDAFTLQADVQVGGTDQLFNIVTAARKVMASPGRAAQCRDHPGDFAWHGWRRENEQITWQPHPNFHRPRRICTAK